jgi:leader peptidase (prepilin peptidase)/N-methyltransferase
LIAITFIDLDHRLILDRMSFPGLLFGLAAAHWVPGFSLLDAVLGAAFGFIFFYLLALAYVRMTGKVGLGGGDVKLLTMLGAYIGVSGVFATVFISSIVGSVIGILWGVLSKEKQLMKTAIPFGPFLVLGALTYFLIGSHLWKEWTGI